MASATTVGAVWAVLDDSGRVVVLFEGADAWLEAQAWTARGYTVERVEQPF